MSFEDIISAIQEKPEIWLSSHASFKNRVVKEKVWRELAARLNIEEEALKKRWKHLKDQYRKELKKKPICRSGDGADDWESTWQYFNMMSFVKDEIIPAPSTGNLVDNTQGTEEDRDTQNDPFFESESASIASPSPTPSTASSSSKLPAKKRTTLREDMLEIERKKLVLMEKRLLESANAKLNEKEDEDELFFKSILPCMKQLTDLQRFQLRGKINDWLVEAMTQNERVSYQNQSFFPHPGFIPSHSARNCDPQGSNEFL